MTTFTLHDPLQRSVHVADLALTDKNTLEAILVPWDQAAKVVDVTETGVDVYQEGFRREAFNLQMREHPNTIRDVVLLPRHGSTETFGHARSLSVAEKGLHSVMSVLPSKMDDVRSMVDEGIDNVSIEFHPLQRNPRTNGRDAVRWRTAAFLKAVAMTPIPAYENAKVLAMRDAKLYEQERTRQIEELDAELAELRAGGEKWRR